MADNGPDFPRRLRPKYREMRDSANFTSHLTFNQFGEPHLPQRTVSAPEATTSGDSGSSGPSQGHGHEVENDLEKPELNTMHLRSTIAPGPTYVKCQDPVLREEKQQQQQQQQTHPYQRSHAEAEEAYRAALQAIGRVAPDLVQRTAPMSRKLHQLRELTLAVMLGSEEEKAAVIIEAFQCRAAQAAAYGPRAALWPYEQHDEEWNQAQHGHTCEPKHQLQYENLQQLQRHLQMQDPQEHANPHAQPHTEPDEHAREEQHRGRIQLWRQRQFLIRHQLQEREQQIKQQQQQQQHQQQHKE